MKHIVIVFILWLLCMGKVSAQCVRPRPLHQGARIALISPSSATDSATIRRGSQVLRAWGYVPVVGRHALKDYHGFAGTAEERAEDLLWALTDSSIDAIMCTRGGDGAVQVLPLIPSSAFAKQPKWLVGFSDVTALHSASVVAGVQSIHGSMLHAISTYEGTDTVSQTLRRILEGQMPRYHIPPNKHNQKGKAVGTLVGGNFAVLSGLAGSPFDCLEHGTDSLILFIEDMGENLTRVDRMLHQLQIRGVLSALKGIVVGQFSKYKKPENGFEDMFDMLHSYLQAYNIPVCYDFPVGHAHLRNFPLIEGARVQLLIDDDGTTLEFLEE